MTLPQYIRENTNDGHNIARVLIDVMEGRLDGARISHRLTAARLLTIYGHKDAADFIADNTPDVPDEEWAERVRVTIDPAISSYIKQRTDGGREICLFLIEVVQGKVEGIQVSDTAYGQRKSSSTARMVRAKAGPCQSPQDRRHPGARPAGRAGSVRRLPRLPPSRPGSPNAWPPAGPPRTTIRRLPSRSPHTSRSRRHMRPFVLSLSKDARFHLPSQKRHNPKPAPTSTPKVYRAASKCIDPKFDPMLEASNEDYFLNYDGCENISCPYHGDPNDPDFNPNAHHY